jgi:hypothetical protein
MSHYVPVDSLITAPSSRSGGHDGDGGAILSGGADSVEHDFDPPPGGGDMNGCVTTSADDLALLGDVELIDELSLLTTQTGRMRARMADIMAELDHRRTHVTGSCAVSC